MMLEKRLSPVVAWGPCSSQANTPAANVPCFLSIHRFHFHHMICCFLQFLHYNFGSRFVLNSWSSGFYQEVLISWVPEHRQYLQAPLQV